MLFKCFDEYRGCELGSLIGVEDFRFPVPFHGTQHDIPAPFGTHRIGNVPAHNFTAVYIDDGKHIHESTEHGDVGEYSGESTPPVPDESTPVKRPIICAAAPLGFQS